MADRSRLERGLWVGLGTTFVAVGAIGVGVPLLPTTPFLLLAAFCFARGSKRLHSWLLENRYLGVYLRAYERGEGVSRPFKVVSLLLLWATMVITVAFLVDVPVLQAILVFIGLAVSIHIVLLKGDGRS